MNSKKITMAAIIVICVPFLIAIKMGVYRTISRASASLYTSIMDNNEEIEVYEDGGLYNIISDMEEDKLKSTPSDLIGKTQWDKIQMGLDYEDGSDTDNDNISDKDEIEVYGTDPLKASTAGDLYLDGYKLENNMDLFTAYDYDGEFEFPFNHSDDMALNPLNAADHHANVISKDGEKYPNYPIKFTVLRSYRLCYFAGEAYINMNVKGYNPSECVVLVSDDAGKSFTDCGFSVDKDNVIKLNYDFDNKKSYTIYLVNKEDYEASFSREEPVSNTLSNTVSLNAAEFTIDEYEETPWTYYLNPVNWFTPSPEKIIEAINTYGTSVSFGSGWIAAHWNVYPHIYYVPTRELYTFLCKDQDLSDEEIEKQYQAIYGHTFEEQDDIIINQHLVIWQDETNTGRNTVIDRDSDTIQAVSMAKFFGTCKMLETLAGNYHNTFPMTKENYPFSDGDLHGYYYGPDTNKFDFIYMWFSFADLLSAAQRNAIVSYHRTFAVTGVNDGSIEAYEKEDYKDKIHSPMVNNIEKVPEILDMFSIYEHVFPFGNFSTKTTGGVCAGMAYLEANLYNNGTFPATGGYNQFQWNLAGDPENQTLMDPKLFDYKTENWVKEHSMEVEIGREEISDGHYLVTKQRKFNENSLSYGEKQFVTCMEGLNAYCNNIAPSTLVTDKTFNPQTNYDRIEQFVGKRLDNGELLIVNVAKRGTDQVSKGHSMLLYGLTYESWDQENDTAILWAYDSNGKDGKIRVRRKELDTDYGKQVDAFEYEYLEYSSGINPEYCLEVRTANLERIL